jgi:hypothetical protein
MAEERNPQEIAFILLDDFVIDPNDMVTACLKYMSHDQIQDMLELNEYYLAYKENYQNNFDAEE